MESVKKFEKRNTILMSGTITKEVEDDQFMEEIKKYLDRYMQNDFGELEEEDIKANINGIKSNLENDRVLARYKTSKGDIYIITELYQSEGLDIITTILFCEDY